MSDFYSIPQVPLIDSTTGQMAVQWQAYFTQVNRALNALGGIPPTPSSTPVLATAYKGNWSSTVTYFPGDEVSSNNNVWRSLQESLNVLPVMGAIWLLVGPANIAAGGSVLTTGGVTSGAANSGGIGANAATYNVVSNTNSSGTISGVTGKANLGIVVNPVSPGFDASVIVTATVQANQTAGTLGDAKVLIGFADDGVTVSYSPQELPVVSAAFGNYTLQWTFSHFAVNAGHGQAIIYADMGAVGDTLNWQRATIQTEYIIR